MSGVVGDRPHRLRGGAQTVKQNDGGDDDESHGHRGKDQPAQMPEPRGGADEDDQSQREQQPPGRQGGKVCDCRRRPGRDADGDREDEIDHQRTDRDKRPTVTESLPDCCRRSAALRVTHDQLPVIDDHQCDDRHDQNHRGHQQGQIAVQRPESCFNRVSDRRNGVGHHGKSECQQ
ncbi:hypothetical protein [Arthrobacter sp. I3]|uniref:hypothetical protein n=1 Tax=Arthrobacter sp. I3 TaxID=218158 RepID=UPI001C1E11D6|nr:hypothetical protein [Arthrobacter sp. I3]